MPYCKASENVAAGTGDFNSLVSCDNSLKDFLGDTSGSAPISVVSSERKNFVCFCFVIKKESVI